MNPGPAVEQIQQILRTKGGCPSATVSLYSQAGKLAVDINNAIGEAIAASTEIVVAVESPDELVNVRTVMAMIPTVQLSNSVQLPGLFVLLFSNIPVPIR